MLIDFTFVAPPSLDDSIARVIVALFLATIYTLSHLHMLLVAQLLGSKRLRRTLLIVGGAGLAIAVPLFFVRLGELDETPALGFILLVLAANPLRTSITIFKHLRLRRCKPH